MKINKQAKRGAKGLYQSCQVDGLLDENRVRRVVEEVIQSKPRGYLAILSHFQRLVRLDMLRRTAAVESSVELSPEERRNIEAQLASRYGRGLTISYQVDPSLIGGVRIKVGSDVYDGSVAGRLHALQESFQAA